MKKSTIRSLAALFLAAGVLISPDVSAQTIERPVKLKDLPKAVQSTAKEQSKGASVRMYLSKETADGTTFYQIALRVSGRDKYVLIDPTGVVVEVVEEIDVASLPPAAMAEIEKHKGGGKIVLVESITKNGGIVAYQARVKSGKKLSEVKVSPAGQLMHLRTLVVTVAR
ncbi:MAG TPA: hypothetical protein VJH03_19290 [Blastocatellia bacterium]|nr:hypothetical protein [Blastocatellia bacterium]